MHVVGGTYYEMVHDPKREILSGSGFRAAACLSHFGNVSFHTYFPDNERLILESNAKQCHFAVLDIKGSQTVRRFEYETPLTKSRVNDWRRDDSAAKILVETDDVILRFGMLEKEAVVVGDKVIYDPQSPQDPQHFWDNGSFAKKLAIVANHSEVKALLGGENYLDGMQSYFKNHPEVVCVVMKYGPLGAKVFTRDGTKAEIPAYRTKDVFSIGTGDVFSAYFAQFWGQEEMDPIAAADYASKAVALYVSSLGSIQNLTAENLDQCSLNPAKTVEGQIAPIYLAGPFFTLADKFMLNAIKYAYSSMEIPIFSPIDDVGVGTPEYIYKGDIEGLMKCSAVFANICGLDAGTIYEIGYARALGKPVVLFVQDCKDKDLTMLCGGGCERYGDFTSAVYNCVWDALEYGN